MEQRQVGRSGLRVSRLGLGTLTWGRDTDEHDARDLLRTFRDAGGTLVETSPGHGAGAAEEVVGALLSTGTARDEVVLASRSAPLSAALSAGPPIRSRRGLLASLESSLSRLGVADLDLWHLDGWSTDVPLEEALSAADSAVSTGRVGYVGLSGCSGWQVARAVTLQEALRRTPFVSVQTEWSLLDRSAERDITAACQGLGLGTFAGSPLGRGVLTGKYRHGIPSDSRAASSLHGPTVEPFLHGRGRSVVDAVATAADGLGVSPLEVSLAWVLARPGLCAAIVGARTPGQLRAAIAAEDAPKLPQAILSALDDVSTDSISP